MNSANAPLVIAVRVAGRKVNESVEVSNHVLQVSQVNIAKAYVVPSSCDQVRIKISAMGNGAVIISDGPGVVSQNKISLASEVVRLRVFGLQCNGAVIISDGTGVVPQLSFGKAPIVIDLGNIKLQCNGAVIISDGTGVVPQFSIGMAPIVIDLGNIKLQCNGAVIISDGAGVVP